MNGRRLQLKHAVVAIGIVLVLGMGAEAPAADAAAPAAAAESASRPAAATSPRSTERISRPAPTAAASARPPLKLHVGDVRKYMMPNEYAAAIGAPDAEKTTIIVEGKRPLLPMKSEQPVPVGIVTPFWMIANPLSAWRALVPDLKAPPPGPPNPVPEREFRWGP
jgi:pyruvate/2-oxoglutarate dehydrogenase complex dihydrolipoamide acyltransferase (E2) component